METWTIHYTVEKMDQCYDMEKDIIVPNIDFVLPEFRHQVRLFKKITGMNIKPNTLNHEPTPPTP